MKPKWLGKIDRNESLVPVLYFWNTAWNAG